MNSDESSPAASVRSEIRAGTAIARRASAGKSNAATRIPSFELVESDLGNVARAWRAALKVRSGKKTRAQFAVGLQASDGRLIAGTTFRSYEQVAKFSAEMSSLGYRAVILDSPAKMQGLDVIYSSTQDNGADDGLS